jgi:phage recombination protein Bet
MTSTALENHAPAALAIRPGQQMWNEKQQAALAVLGIKGASTADLAVFMHVCQNTGLDPFTRQIHGIMRREKVTEYDNGQKNERWVDKFTIQVGIDGFRVIRDRIAERKGLRVEYEDTIWYDADGNGRDVWLWDDPPAACRVVVLVDGRRFPSVLKFSEYCQYSRDGGKPVAQWASKPAHMIEKCAEANGLRRAFPNDMAGIRLEDEMPPAEVNGTTPPRGRVTAGEIIERGPAAEDDWPRGTVTRHNSDASDEGAKQEAAPRPPARATSGQLSMLGQRLGKLGVGDENRLGTLEKLSGRDLKEPAELTQDEAAHIRGLLDRCTDGKGAPDRGALVELLATGQLPEAEKTGDGDE